MKRALLHSLEPGRITEVVDKGNEFEVADEFTWVDCPDDITTNDSFDINTNTFKKFNLLENPGFVDNGYLVARSVAYSSIGNQLDMIYKELMATGSISATGPWAEHITQVKNAIPKDDIEAVIAWNTNNTPTDI